MGWVEYLWGLFGLGVWLGAMWIWGVKAVLQTQLSVSLLILMWLILMVWLRNDGEGPRPGD